MNSAFAFAVGLLHAALALLGFVQLHPELPQASRDQAQQVAQQAMTQATQVLTNASSTAPAAQIEASSLTSWAISNPADRIISGNASGVASVGIYVVMAGSPADHRHTAFANDSVSVINGHWLITVPASRISCNTYNVFVYGVNKTLLTSGTFVGSGCASGH